MSLQKQLLLFRLSRRTVRTILRFVSHSQVNLCDLCAVDLASAILLTAGHSVSHRRTSIEKHPGVTCPTAWQSVCHRCPVLLLRPFHHIFSAVGKS